MLIFEKVEKPQYPKMNFLEQGCQNQQQTQAIYDTISGIQAQVTLVGGKRSYYCVMPLLANLSITRFPGG